MANYTHQPINLGPGPGTGTGDPGRVGGEKINSNFAVAFAALPDTLVYAEPVLSLTLNDGTVMAVTISGGGGGGGGMDYEGGWITGVQYAEQDVVTYLGSSYVADGTPVITTDVPGVAAVWDQLVGGAADTLDGVSDREVVPTYTEPTGGVCMLVALRTAGVSKWQWVQLPNTKLLVGDSADISLVAQHDLLDVTVTGNVTDAAMRLVGTGSLFENKLEPWRNPNADEFSEWGTALYTDSDTTVGAAVVVPDGTDGPYFGAETLLDSEGHWGGDLLNATGTPVLVTALQRSMGEARNYYVATDTPETDVADTWASNAGKVLTVVDAGGTLQEVWAPPILTAETVFDGADFNVGVSATWFRVGSYTAPFDMLVHRIIFTRDQVYPAAHDFEIQTVNDGGLGGYPTYSDVAVAALWVLGAGYTVGNLVVSEGGWYICINNHTATAGDEPESGGAWAAEWDATTKADATVTAASVFAAGDKFKVEEDITGIQQAGMLNNVLLQGDGLRVMGRKMTLVDPGPNYWLNGDTYAIGDFVYGATTDAHFYCETAHVAATATDEPGQGGANDAAYWELWPAALVLPKVRMTIEYQKLSAPVPFA
jgi:hypothetical protein